MLEGSGSSGPQTEGGAESELHTRRSVEEDKDTHPWARAFQ